MPRFSSPAEVPKSWDAEADSCYFTRLAALPHSDRRSALFAAVEIVQDESESDDESRNAASPARNVEHAEHAEHVEHAGNLADREPNCAPVGGAVAEVAEVGKPCSISGSERCELCQWLS